MAERIISGSIPVVPRHADPLPDTGSFRQPVVQTLFACSPARVWRRLSASRVPTSRKSSPHSTYRNVAELRATFAAAGK
jgi:hypothetical protein